MQSSNPHREGKFRVRKLEISDQTKGFIELLQQLSVCDSVSVKEFEERFQEISTYGDDHFICVIEDDLSGKIIATGSIFIEKKFLRNCGKVGHIEDVVVDSSAQGLQLGKRIVEFLTEHAHALGCYKVILDCSVDNKTFYEKCGFKQKEIQMVNTSCFCVCSCCWELDPLFSAAEVVQDSADRAESIFRLLLHEKSLVQYEHPDKKLLTSMEYHRCELKTIIETAKWQLEDFERAVGVAAMMETSQTREHVITRPMQFIRAIQEKIILVEKGSGDPLMGDSVRNSEWVSLNEQDSDGLALFITGGNPNGYSNHNNLDDCNILRRFLDPDGENPTASGVKDDEIVEHGKNDIEKLNGNEDFHLDQYKDSIKQSNLRKVSSYYSSRMSLDALTSLHESNYNGRGEDASWDLEANKANPNCLSQESKLRGSSSRLNFLWFLNTKWTTDRSRARNYTKRLKDGEDQRHIPSFNDISYSARVIWIIPPES